MVSQLKCAIAVGTGGFVGAVLRYTFSEIMKGIPVLVMFPAATMIVNVIGCFAIGLVAGWSDGFKFFQPSMRLFLIIGLFGSFTTFSTFAYENLVLFRDNNIPLAALNVLLHLLLGIAAVFGGFWLAERISVSTVS